MPEEGISVPGNDLIETPSYPRAGTAPVYVLGWREQTTAVPSSAHLLGSIAANGAATGAFGPFEKDGVYEFTVFDAGGLSAGTPENIYVAPVKLSTGVADANSRLLPTSVIPVFRVHFLSDQNYLACLSVTGGAKTMAIYAARLV